MRNVTLLTQATYAELHLAFGIDSTTLSVRDDGCGFTLPESPAEMTDSGFFDLLSIQERAEFIGANVTIQSTLGEGTHITIALLTPESKEQMDGQCSTNMFLFI